MDQPRVTLGAVNTEAEDPVALATFWSGVTGGDFSTNGGSTFLPAVGPNGFAMFFQPLTGPKPSRSTMHLDLTVPWGTRHTEVDRLVGLGATWQWDVLDEHPHVQWTTLGDPEGNLFCVAEHPPAS